MPSPIADLQSAGFSDEEIGEWSTQQRQTLSQAGFGDEEIDHYLGGPPPSAQGFLERVTKAADPVSLLGGDPNKLGANFWTGFKEGGGLEPALDPEQEAMYRKLGLLYVAQPIAAAGKVSGAILRGLAEAVPGIGGPLAAGAEAFPAGPYTGFPHPTAPLMRVKPGPDGTPVHEAIGDLPESQDFADAARSVAGLPTPSPLFREKLEGLWTDHGIHPAEVAHDAETDPTIAQDLASSSGELPARYVGDNQPVPRTVAPLIPGETAAPAQSPAIGEEPPASMTMTPGEEAPPRPAQATSAPPQIQAFSPDQLKVDAQRFQFKEGTDQEGVSNRLQGVKEWDPLKAGLGIVFEDSDGSNYIADGHQRLALAQRIAAADPVQEPKLNAWVLKASDGVTDQDVRAMAAAKNIAEGTGTPVDAAKVLRDRPDLLPALPPRSELVRQAQGLMNLDPNAFGMAVNDIVPPNYAAIVGRLAPEDGAMQNALLDLLAKTQPDNVTQAESIVRQGLDAGLHTETQTSLFGDQDLVSSLYGERAKILDRSLKELRRDRIVFQRLIDNEDVIKELGNELATNENARRATIDGQATQLLQALANRKGPLSDALTRSARGVAERRFDRAAAARDFVAELRRQAASGDLARLADGAARGSMAAAGEARPGGAAGAPAGIAARGEPEPGARVVGPAEQARADAQVQFALTAYHGTPHTFEAEPGAPLGRFSLEKIGTGEGAHTYGHGIYLAEEPEVAEGYAKRLGTKKREDYVNALTAYGNISRAVAEQKADELFGSHIYETHVKAPEESLLDWDKPLSEQPAIVEKLKAANIPTGDLKRSGGDWHDGVLAYDTRADPKTGRPDAAELSKRLSAAGIRGIRYLDQNSRTSAAMAPIEINQLKSSIKAAQDAVVAIRDDIARNRANPQMLPAYFEGEQQQIAEREARIAQWQEKLAQIENGKNVTRNLVIFDPKDIEITGRNGEKLPPAEKPTVEQTDQGAQLVLPGAERSAQQAAASREAEGHGRIAPPTGQQEPGGLFAEKPAGGQGDFSDLFPKPGAPPIGLSIAAVGEEPPIRTPAEQEILDRINIGGSTDKRPMTWSRLYTNTIDKLFPIAEATARTQGQGVRAALGGVTDLATAQNPYQLARLLAGTAGKADHWLNFGSIDFNTYETVGPSLKSILDPMKDDLDGLRAFAASVRALELEHRGIETGMSLSAARQVGAAGLERYSGTLEKLIDYQDRLAAYLRDSGILSADGYAAMKEANRLYVPFNRVFNAAERGQGMGASLQASNPIHRIEGSEREIIDPIESIVRNTYTYIAMAEKNAVGQKLVDILREASDAHGAIGDVSEAHLRDAVANPATRFADVPVTDVDGSVLPPEPRQPDLFPERGPIAREAEAPIRPGEALPQDIADQIREVLRAQGLSDELFDFMAQGAAPREGEIGVFRDGVRETWAVDPELASAMKALDRQSVGAIESLLAKPASWLRAGAVLTPDFQLRHTFRDYMYAAMTGKGVFSPVDMARGFIGLLSKDEDFQNWLKSGGSNISRVAMDRRYLQENLEKLNGETGILERAWNVIADPATLYRQKMGAAIAAPFHAADKFILNPLRMVTELAENASHLGAFKKTLREAELPEGAQTAKAEIQAAGFASRDVAVDAARIGAQMRAYNMITAFANITLQDTDRVARAFIQNPIPTTLKIAGGIMLPSALLWAANHDDPRYKEIPQWEKDLFWIIMTGKAKEDGGDGGHIFRVPKPWGMGVIFGSGTERALEAYNNSNPDAFREFGKSIADTVVPNFYPSAISPVIDQFANRSAFTNRTLVPAELEGQLPEYQYAPYTSETAKKLGQLIAAFPRVRQESLDMDSPMAGGVARALTTPILLENYLRAWTGNLGVYALNIADAGLRKAGLVPDPPRPADTLADIPVIKAFAVRYPSGSAESIQRFYDDYERNKRFFDTWKAKAQEGDLEALDRIQAAGGPRLFVQLDGIHSALAEHSHLIRDIWKDPGIAPDEKRQLIDTIYYSEIQIAHAGREQMQAVDRALAPR